MNFTQRLLYILILVSFFSCRSIRPDRVPVAEPQPELPTAISRINVPIVIPISFLEENLNKDWSSKLFADKGIELGSGLFADLDVTRTGKINIRAVENNTLKVKVPMKAIGDLKIEKRVFGQNLSTNFPFNENLSPEISFKPEIGNNWDLNVKNIQIDNWGRSLSYNLLGFEINLEPLIKNQLQRVIDNQFSAADLTQFDFKNMAQSTWDAFSEPYTIQEGGITAHFYSVPERVKVKEEFTLDQNLVLYLGIEGEMFSKLGEKPIVPKKPLPNISKNEDTENLIDLTLPLRITYEELDNYLNQVFQGQQIRTNRTTVLRPSNLKTSQYGDKTLLSMDFLAIREGKKDVSGKMYFAGKPRYDEESQALVFDEPKFDVDTGDFFTNLGIRMRKGKVQRQIKKMAVLSIGDMMETAKEELQRQGNITTDFADFNVIQPTLEIEGIYPSKEAITIHIHAKGKVGVNLKKF
ncbi:MAG: DUF4403 family protein [Mongoliibacter sp.]|uniref:DUF4403 family protein n=1 Tax=Mongoliibacter sp. TaxID=2022438 RepID=UPI0012F1EC20|nr:DUF4403 family protein [Mongoliibacter sp.]TVP50318.1 MAG: DUF4403 family protein [Mongoliibacter sp.]